MMIIVYNKYYYDFMIQIQAQHTFKQYRQKTYPWHAHPAKTQITLHTRTIWSVITSHTLDSQGCQAFCCGQDRADR